MAAAAVEAPGDGLWANEDEDSELLESSPVPSVTKSPIKQYTKESSNVLSLHLLLRSTRKFYLLYLLVSTHEWLGMNVNDEIEILSQERSI